MRAVLRQLSGGRRHRAGRADQDAAASAAGVRTACLSAKTTSPLNELEGAVSGLGAGFDVPADTPLNVAQLAKQFSVPTHVLQEFLSSLGQFGLVERRVSGSWQLLGFTPEYAVELSDFRTLLELNAARTVTSLPRRIRSGRRWRWTMNMCSFWVGSAPISAISRAWTRNSTPPSTPWSRTASWSISRR